jgi:hypothetical protein
MSYFSESFQSNNKDEKSNDISTIKVGIPILGEPILYINHSGDIDGLAYKVWQEVLKDMEKQNDTKYDVKYVIIEKSNIEHIVEGLKQKKYDLVLGDFGIDPQRLNFINYTSPYMSVKDVGVYLNDTHASVEYETFSRIVSLLMYPFVGLIILSIVSALYAYYVSDQKNTNLAGSFVQMMNGILGDRGGLLNGPAFIIRPGKTFFSWLVAIFVILLSFAFLFYIQSVAISKSLHIISNSKDPFTYPQNKKVLVPKGSPAILSLKECCNIDVIEAKSDKSDVESIANEFLKRHKKEHLIGFYHSGIETSYWKKDHKQFAISESAFSSPSPVSFMTSKFKPELLYIINKSIAEVAWESILNDQCKKFIGRVCFAS